MNDQAGPRALVTGASAGIGRAIADCLAQRGYRLVLTARRADALEEAATQLRTTHGVDVQIVAEDLATTGGAARLWEIATAAGSVDVLVNNAGFGTFRKFGSTDWARDADMLQLNVVTLAELCHHFVVARRARPTRERSYILNVASIAAFQAVPNFASYAATKAYVRSFSEALHYELRDENIHVTCLCPGGTVTEFHTAAGAGNYGRLANAAMLSASDVAEVGVRAMLRGTKTIVPGVLNKLSVFIGGLAPSGITTRSAMKLMGAPQDNDLPPRTL